MITPKDKAKQLTDSFKDFVNPYIGSGMLSNTYDDEAILWQSKRCAVVAINEIVNAIKDATTGLSIDFIDESEVKADIDFWNAVKQEVELL